MRVNAENWPVGLILIGNYSRLGDIMPSNTKNITNLISLWLGCLQHVGESAAQVPRGAHEVVALGPLVVHEGGQHLHLPRHVRQVGGDGVDGGAHRVVIGSLALTGQGHLDNTYLDYYIIAQS
mgnify:CR=1 FL=1